MAGAVVSLCLQMTVGGVNFGLQQYAIMHCEVKLRKYPIMARKSPHMKLLVRAWCVAVLMRSCSFPGSSSVQERTAPETFSMACQHCSRKVSFEVPKLPSDPIVEGVGGGDGVKVSFPSVGFETVGFESVGFESSYRSWSYLQSKSSLSTVSTVFDGKGLDWVEGVNNRIRITEIDIFLL